MSGPVDVDRPDPLQRVSLNFLSIQRAGLHVPQSWWDDVSSTHSLLQSSSQMTKQSAYSHSPPGLQALNRDAQKQARKSKTHDSLEIALKMKRFGYSHPFSIEDPPLL
jgi:hypothetical protein